MAKKKQARFSLVLECIECRKDFNKLKFGVSRYITSKNRANTQLKLELKKYCKYCNSRTLHREVK